MSAMNGEVYAAPVEAGASEDRAREAAKSVPRHDTDIAGVEASQSQLEWMSGSALAFVVAIMWRVFGSPSSPAWRP